VARLICGNRWPVGTTAVRMDGLTTGRESSRLAQAWVGSTIQPPG
jgi:hypothetical protein